MMRNTDPVIAVSVRDLRISRREMGIGRATDSLSLPVQQVVGSPPGQRHNCQRGILVGVGDETGAVGDEQIFHVMRLAVLIQSRSCGMLAHANRAYFVDDHATIGDPVGIRAVGSFWVT